MRLSISDYLRKFSFSILAFTDPVKNKLTDFSKEISTKKLQPEQIMEKAKGMISLIDNAMNIQKQQLIKFGDKVVPIELVPHTMSGQPTIKEVIAETIELYSDFKKQTMNSSQLKYLPTTIDKIVNCFDAVTNTLKAKTAAPLYEGYFNLLNKYWLPEKDFNSFKKKTEVFFKRYFSTNTSRADLNELIKAVKNVTDNSAQLVSTGPDKYELALKK